MLDFIKKLALREKEEAEERKKRSDDDEESKYDMASFLAESKRWRKTGGKYNFNRKGPISSLSSGKQIQSSGAGLKRTVTQSLADEKVALKKKNTMIPKKNQTNGGLGTEIDFAKQRKNSLLIGGSKEEQVKRYH